MPESWLPQQGAAAPIEAGTLVVARTGDARAFVLTAAGGKITVAEHEGPLPANAVHVPAPGGDGLPRYEDGSPLPPFDEAPLFEALDRVVGATMEGELDLSGNPYGARAFRYSFVDGRLAELRFAERVPRPAALGRTPPDGLQLTWSASWERWLLWRAGQLSGEQFLEGAQIAGTWPYIALAQGLFEHDAFVAGRRTLPAVAPELALLQLIDF